MIIKKSAIISIQFWKFHIFMLYKTFDVIFFESLSLKLKCNEEFYNVSCHRQRIVNQNSTEWILVEYNCYYGYCYWCSINLCVLTKTTKIFLYSVQVSEISLLLWRFFCDKIKEMFRDDDWYDHCECVAHKKPRTTTCKFQIWFSLNFHYV